eukprot:CAMPEP_0116961152 /NCGR_PEP_ID=MMETSP0467-20121206/46393_1 /TAXON_ID=283647 /ORGANISM="Mesodinium pulex, Strain SPMC105" /LENGTH=60 /DNA_ID=CAMNT_0004649031 /DNA_START=19 /DNA_END=201 /DNA_ORIENTATION=-
MSFKKMYAHSGGCILINKNSSCKLANLDFNIKKLTTSDYGCGFQAYCGLNGDSFLDYHGG